MARLLERVDPFSNVKLFSIGHKGLMKNKSGRKIIQKIHGRSMTIGKEKIDVLWRISSLKSHNCHTYAVDGMGISEMMHVYP